MPRYKITVNGRASPRFVDWLEALIGLLRALPRGWRATVVVERDTEAEDDPS